jgi:hypothetical protein
MEVTETNVLMGIEVSEVADGCGSSDWIVLRCGFKRIYGLEAFAVWKYWWWDRFTGVGRWCRLGHRNTVDDRTLEG